MKQKELQDKVNIFFDQIEVFLKSVPKKEKREIGIAICMHTAMCTESTVKSGDDVFKPLSVLSDAEAQLQTEICDIIDEEIGNALKESIEKDKKKD